jgi:hypothetical protein
VKPAFGGCQSVFFPGLVARMASKCRPRWGCKDRDYSASVAADELAATRWGIGLTRPGQHLDPHAGQVPPGQQVELEPVHESDSGLNLAHLEQHGFQFLPGQCGHDGLHTLGLPFNQVAPLHPGESDGRGGIQSARFRSAKVLRICGRFGK